MSVVTLISAVLHLALFGGGIAVALTLRGRDPRAALLTALGFGCVLLSFIVAVGEGFMAPSIMRAASGGAQARTAFLFFGTVITLIRMAGFVLIFFGLLRVVRRRDPVAPWMEAGR